jgi:8-oxo-dGTP pyrophosphatase MutT (NUDIX family)
MATFYQNKQTHLCSNCGGTGHTFRFCSEPVSSYGVLVFRWIGSSETWPQTNILCSTPTNYTGTDNLIPQVLLIQRKDTLGFMDIMRGKYKVNEPDYIKKQLRGMTENERKKLETMEFDDLWHDLWGSDTETSKRYAYDRITSKQKLSELRAGIELPSGEKYSLNDLLRQEPVKYDTPEWGFPKGRRDPHETDIQCAFRELEEETSILENELIKVFNIAPLIEQFYGSNGIHYRHSYYVAQYSGTRTISFNSLNSEMAREIGDLKWINIDEAAQFIRPENIEKKNILQQLAFLLRQFTPVIKFEMYGNLLNENNTEEQQRQYVYRIKSDGAIQEQMDGPRRFFGTRRTPGRI